MAWVIAKDHGPLMCQRRSVRGLAKAVRRLSLRDEDCDGPVFGHKVLASYPHDVFSRHSPDPRDKVLEVVMGEHCRASSDLYPEVEIPVEAEDESGFDLIDRFCELPVRYRFLYEMFEFGIDTFLEFVGRVPGSWRPAAIEERRVGAGLVPAPG